VSEEQLPTARFKLARLMAQGKSADTRQMKITGVFPVSCTCHVLMTDEEFSSDRWRCVRHRKKLRVADDTREVEMAVEQAEVVIRGKTEFISFIVPQIQDRAVQDFILGRTAEVY